MHCQDCHSPEGLTPPALEHPVLSEKDEGLPILLTRGNIDTMEPMTPLRGSTDLLIPMKDRLMSLPHIGTERTSGLKLSAKKKVLF